MAKFIADNELNLQIEKIFEEAKESLILISPYIKLHDRLLSVLRSKKDNYKLKIAVLFGKNEEDPSRSMNSDDLSFFTQFPNIVIMYEKRLHAKYYANDYCAVLTSMNLYSYSQDNNIEGGILTEQTGILGRSEEVDVKAWEYFSRILSQAEVIYKKEPQFESVMFGLTKKYTGSSIVIDRINSFFSNKQKLENKTINSFNIYQPSREQLGYCIRTGVQIPFNIQRPLSDTAFRVWNEFGDFNYAEKYCHFTGEPSHGDTSYSRPILQKNWRKAKEVFNL